MSLACMVGLDAMLLFGSAVTKKCKISKQNKTMKKLLKYTGFPSIQQLANQDAFSLIKQWQILRPEYFIMSKRDDNIICARVDNKYK